MGLPTRPYSLELSPELGSQQQPRNHEPSAHGAKRLGHPVECAGRASPGRKEPWQFLYKNLFPTRVTKLPWQPIISHLYLSCLGLQPSQSRSPATNITPSAKTLNPGAWEEIKCHYPSWEPGVSARPLGWPQYVPGTECKAQTGRREPLTAPVHGGDAGLAPGVSSHWPGSSLWERGASCPSPGLSSRQLG